MPAKGSLLIVDDDASVRESLTDFFEDYSYLVSEAENGQAAFDLFQSKKPDLVITDLRMPKMDGLSLLAKIKECDESVPVIIISGANDIQDAVSALRLGAADFFLKPVEDMQIVYNTVNNALKMSQLEKENIQYRDHLENLVKERTAELEIAKNEAEKANYIKTQFLANISHEFRTPLNAIIGFSGLATDQTLTIENYEKYFKIINKNGENLLSIVEDILDISKIEAGAMNFEEIDFNIDGLLEDVLHVVTPMANKKKIKISYSIDTDMPKLFKGDSVKLHQILSNLINNSLKFTEEGEIRILVSLASEKAVEKEMTLVQFAVKDTGIGISQDMHNEIFKPFAQADISHTRKYGGVGLGLSIVKKFVEALNGSVCLSSTLGEGSEFIIKLPLTESIVQDEENKMFFWGDEQYPLKGIRVLVVEDHPESQQLAVLLLQKLQCVVDAVSNGKEAVEKVKEVSYDFILMDLQMPEMDGFVATKIIKEAINKNLAIIALTASAMQSDRDKCLQAGMVDHVSKPIGSAKIKDVLLRNLPK